MSPRAIRSQNPVSSVSISIEELEIAAQDWLYDCEFRQHTKATLTFRRDLLAKFFWFLRREGFEKCGTLELRQFFSYCVNGHTEEYGRWGNPKLKSPLSARTVKDYHGHLKSLFNYLIEQDFIAVSPMAKIATPIARSHQVQPFSPEQVTALFKAAESSNWPLRDTAILALLLDSGLRASELCNLKWKDIDLKSRRCTVLGKGNKVRSVYFGLQTSKILFKHQRASSSRENAPIFITRDGTLAGEAITRSGLRQLIQRLGVRAGVKAVRCSPHTFRHTFAVSYLRNGGQSFSLMASLGHTNIQMTQRYVSLSQSDLQNQHLSCSPLDNLKRNEKLNS